MLHIAFARVVVGARAVRLLLAAVLVGLVSACIPSLHPVYDTDSLIAVEGIEGGWSGPEGSELYVLSRRDDGLYRAVYLSDGDGPVALDVGFTKIAGSTYADFSVTLPGRLSKDEFVSGLVGIWHGIYRTTIESDNSVLRLQPMSLTELDASLEANAGALAHARTDRLRLLAETAALRSYIAENPALFDTEGLRFVHVK